MICTLENFRVCILIFFSSNLLQYDEDSAISKLTARERRFIKFASSEYDGQLYMTPQDFLESVVEQEPRRKYLNEHIKQLFT